MKRLMIAFFLIFLFSNSSLALEEETVDFNYGNIDNAFGGLKPVSDEEFQQTLQRVKDQKKTFIEKTIEKFKGKKIETDPNMQKSGYPSETEILKEGVKEDPSLMLSVNIAGADSNVIPIGHYKLQNVKDSNGAYYINFLQGKTIVGRLKARETDDDSHSNNRINYAECFEVRTGLLKVIGATMEDTLEGFAPIIQSEE